MEGRPGADNWLDGARRTRWQLVRQHQHPDQLRANVGGVQLCSGGRRDGTRQAPRGRVVHDSPCACLTAIQEHKQAHLDACTNTRPQYNLGCSNSGLSASQKVYDAAMFSARLTFGAKGRFR